MARSVRVEMILDTLRAVRGAKDLSKEVGGAAQALDETARQGKRAGEAIDGAGDEMSEAARAAAALDKQIDQLTGSLKEMAIAQALTGDNFSKQIREQEAQLRRVTRNRKLLGDLGEGGGEEMALGLSTRFSQRIGPLLASAPISPAILAAAAPAVPALGALMSAAVIGGAAGVGVIGGLVLAARDERVKAAGADLGEMVLGDLERRAEGFVQPTLNSIERVRRGWWSLDPDLDRIFDADRFVEPLVDGAITGARAVVGGIADAVDEADPVVEAFRQLLAQTGDAAGDTFTLLAQDSRQAASAVEDLTLAVSNMVTTTGFIVHAGAQVHGYLGEIDKVIDRTRYWIEDNNRLDAGLEHLGFTTDWTADGFRKGSMEAEAYRKATLGTAQAADFAILKQAGMTDAQIAGVDASGKYRAELARVKAQTDAVAASNDHVVVTQDVLIAVQKRATDAQAAYRAMLDGLGGSASRAGRLMDGLRQASENMFGAAIAGVDANEQYEASWDRLSESVKDNGRSLNIHSAAGRANRDVLQALFEANNDSYLANVANGMSLDKAREKHERRTAAIVKEADRLGFNIKTTREMNRVYGQIPPKKITDLIASGIDQMIIELKRVFIAQRALAEGKTIAQVRHGGTMAAFSALAGGGPVPGWSPTPTADNIPIWATADEFMVRQPSARKMQRENPGALEHINRYGELPGYAGGGRIAGTFVPVETRRRMRFPVDVSDSYVMPLALALSKVVPGAPSGGATAPWMERMLEARFGVNMISGYRPGSRTLSGALSYHALNRAVDFPPLAAMARFMYQNYKSRLREAITPYQQYNVHNGQSHHYSGAVWRQHAFGYRNAHNHFAMANGGVIREPVFGVGASGHSYSFGERGPERVTPMGAAGTTIVINAPVTVAQTGASPQQIARAVSREIGRAAEVMVRTG